MHFELVHPMIIHFPIVLLIQAALIDVLVVVRGGTLCGTEVLPLVGRLSLLAGAAAAVAAVVFGYIAHDIAMTKGFSDALIEQHEGLGVTTASVFVALAILRFAAPRLGFRFEGRRSQAVAALTLAGVALLITTAYFGGSLVYGHGVNVATTTP
jgi:uncharacterized membrane protein